MAPADVPAQEALAEHPSASEAEEEAGYPPLQSVPPRPQLSYTVQQQREIVEALVADRENARYTDQVVRYRSGLSSMPPPPEPPQLPAGNLDPVIAAREPAPAEPGLSEEETLFGFIAALRAQIRSDEPETAPAPEPGPAASASASEPQAVLEPSAGQEAAPDVAEAPAPPEPAVAKAPVPPGQDALAAREAAEPGALAPTPLPPARSAVAARLAASPDVVDLVVDQTVPQTPLPPGQSAIAARLTEADQAAADPAPLPALRPATVLDPPPFKPIVPVSVPADRRPPDDRSADARSPWMAADAVL